MKWSHLVLHSSSTYIGKVDLRWLSFFLKSISKGILISLSSSTKREMTILLARCRDCLQQCRWQARVAQKTLPFGITPPSSARACVFCIGLDLAISVYIRYRERPVFRATGVPQTRHSDLFSLLDDTSFPNSRSVNCQVVNGNRDVRNLFRIPGGRIGRKSPAFEHLEFRSWLFGLVTTSGSRRLGVGMLLC